MLRPTALMVTPIRFKKSTSENWKSNIGKTHQCYAIAIILGNNYSIYSHKLFIIQIQLNVCACAPTTISGGLNTFNADKASKPDFLQAHLLEEQLQAEVHLQQVSFKTMYEPL